MNLPQIEGDGSHWRFEQRCDRTKLLQHFKRLPLATPWYRVRRDRSRGKQTHDKVTAVIQVEAMVAVIRVVAPEMEVYSTSRHILKAELLGFADRCELV